MEIAMMQEEIVEIVMEIAIMQEVRASHGDSQGKIKIDHGRRGENIYIDYKKRK
jgi:AMMECR1 domain-containing protein